MRYNDGRCAATCLRRSQDSALRTCFTFDFNPGLDPYGNLPRPKKLSAGEFFAHCGAPACSIPRAGHIKNTPEPKFDPYGNLPRTFQSPAGALEPGGTQTAGPCFSIPARVMHLPGIPERKLQQKAPCFQQGAFCLHDPYGNRTHVTAVKGPCLNRLTNGPYEYKISLKQQVLCPPRLQPTPVILAKPCIIW